MNQEKSVASEEAGRTTSALREQRARLQGELVEVKARLRQAENEMEAVKDKYRRDLETERESHGDLIKVLDSEKQMAVRDLKMQLEIANAQRTEFEEACKLLKDEIRDLHEDKKILEKKGASLTKESPHKTNASQLS